MQTKLHSLTPKSLQSVDNEMQCEVLTEIISIIWKVFHRITQKGDRQIIQNHFLNEEIFEDLQLLLGIKHNLLLRCVLESLLTFLEK